MGRPRYFSAVSDAEIRVVIFEFAISNDDEQQQPMGRYGWRILVDGAEIASSFTHYETPEEAAGVVAWLRTNAHQLPVPDV